MNLANLTRWDCCCKDVDCMGSGPGLPNARFVKFEDVVELLKQADNSVNRKLPTWEEFQTWCFNRDGDRDAPSLFRFFTGNYPA
jgi:hypothetical protein